MSAARNRRRNAVAPWLLVAPALVLYGLMLVAPMLNLLVQSFFDFNALSGIIRELTTVNYVRFFTDAFYLSVLGRTLKLALMVSVICLVASWPIAYQLSRTGGRLRVYLTLIVLAPLLISVVVRTFGWVVILGPNGLVNSALQAMGLTSGPIRLLFTEGAVVLGMVHVLMPFMILSVTAALDNIDPSLDRAARNLGASSARTLMRVTVPLSLPGVLAGTVIVFGLSASAFVTPAVLGGSGLKYMSSLIYQNNVLILNWPFGGALSIVLLAMTLGVVMGYTRTIERGRFRGVFQQ